MFMKNKWFDQRGNMNLTRRSARLFNNRTLLLLAMDRAQIGLVPGLENPYTLIDSLSSSYLDGFILNVGLAKHMQQKHLLNKLLILRTSVSNSILSKEIGDYHKNFVHPGTALELGADAVLSMLLIGDGDASGIQHAAQSIDHYHRYGLNVIIEILGKDFSQTETFEVQANGARIAAELGADAVKVFHCEHFEELVRQCPIPVILAGGAKNNSITGTIIKAHEQGVSGFALGRNIFQSDNQVNVIEEIAMLLGNKGCCIGSEK